MYCNKPDSEKKWRLSCRDSNLREKRDEAVERKKFPAKILLKFQLGTNFQDGKKALKGLPTKLNKEKMITKLKFTPKKIKTHQQLSQQLGSYVSYLHLSYI